MSKATHTPGPWYADQIGAIWRRPPGDLYEQGGGVAGDRPIAAAYLGWRSDDRCAYPVLENARLIAAAPDLLEACRRLLGWSFWEQGGSAARDAEFARAAIRKATGEKEQEARDVT